MKYFHPNQEALPKKKKKILMFGQILRSGFIQDLFITSLYLLYKISLG